MGLDFMFVRINFCNVSFLVMLKKTHVVTKVFHLSGFYIFELLVTIHLLSRYANAVCGTTRMLS